MSRLSLKQIIGLQKLIQDTVAASADTTEDVHLAMMRQPYALLQRIPVIAQPAWVVEQVQQTITRGVYQSIRLVNHAVGTVAFHALSHCEKSSVSTASSPAKDFSSRS